MSLILNSNPESFSNSPEAEHCVKDVPSVKILLVGNSPVARYVEAYTLTALGCTVSVVTNHDEALDLLAYQFYQALFIDWLPNNETAILLQQLKILHPNLPIIVIANDASYQESAKAAGAAACLIRPMLLADCQKLFSHLGLSSAKPKKELLG